MFQHLKAFVKKCLEGKGPLGGYRITETKWTPELKEQYERVMGKKWRDLGDA